MKSGGGSTAKSAIVIAGHHLRRMARNPGLVVLLMAIPLTIAGIEYAAFGPSTSSGKLPPIKVLFLDEDGTLASGAVPQFFAGGPMKDRFELANVHDLDEAKRLFTRGTASALIVVPKGFQTAVLEGRAADLRLYKNPIQTFSPEVVDSVLQMGTTIANGLIAQAREPLDHIRRLIDSNKDVNEEDVAAISKGFYRAGERFVSLGALKDISVDVSRPKGGGGMGASNPSDFFAYVFPGLVLFALMFISQSLALRLLRDRSRGLQRRLAMTGTSRAAIQAGGLLYLICGLLVILVILGAIGHFIFRIQLHGPLALTGFGVAFAAFAGGLQVSIAGMSRSERGSQAVASAVILVLSLLGGSFVPVESYPPFLKAVGLLTPNGATQQGMVGLLVHQQTLAGVASHLATVWIWGVVALALAVALDRWRLAA